MNKQEHNSESISLQDELNDLIIRKMAENKLLHKLRDALVAEHDGDLASPAPEEGKVDSCNETE